MIVRVCAMHSGLVVNFRLDRTQETLATLLFKHADVSVMVEINPLKGCIFRKQHRRKFLHLRTQATGRLAEVLV